MALVNCKECGAEVSDKALDCPKCGATLRKPKRTLFGKLVKWTFIGFNILMLLWMIFGVGGAVVRPEFFDDVAYDIPEEAWAVDDVWLSAQLARRGIAIYCPRRHPMPKAADHASLEVASPAPWQDAQRYAGLCVCEAWRVEARRKA